MKTLGFKKIFIAMIVLLFAQIGATQTGNNLKEWTFLVYLNADNNLYPFSYLNLQQMEKVGSSAGVNVVAQFDPEPKNLATTRYLITQNPNPIKGKVTSQVLQQLPETDMGNPQTLADFLTWGVKTFPAKKYAVVIWNHGNGWQGVSYDDNPRTYLSMPMLRKGLEAMNVAISQQRGSARAVGSQIDLINFDACLMSTLEVAYELKDVAKYLVGSQFLEPGDGENYTSFLQPLVAKPQMDGKELAEIMVYQYALNYQNDNSDINYAAIDLSRVTQFTTLFDQASKMLNVSAAKPQIKKAFGSTSFDLITGLTAAKKAATSDANAVAALDQVLQSYGYPAEGVFRGKLGGTGSFANNEAMLSLNSVTRTYPSDVYYRYAVNGNWAKGKLAANAMGEYQFVFPNGKPKQYFVVAQKNLRVGFKEIAAQEALSTYLKDGQDPVIYHNQFPATSPLVADAYTRGTRGAHGMTLYSLAGMMAQNNSATSQAGSEILKQYKQLSFATVGAPQWTGFFGQ